MNIVLATGEELVMKDEKHGRYYIVKKPDGTIHLYVPSRMKDDSICSVVFHTQKEEIQGVVALIRTGIELSQPKFFTAETVFLIGVTVFFIVYAASIYLR